MTLKPCQSNTHLKHSSTSFSASWLEKIRKIQRKAFWAIHSTSQKFLPKDCKRIVGRLSTRQLKGAEKLARCPEWHLIYWKNWCTDCTQMSKGTFKMKLSFGFFSFFVFIVKSKNEFQVPISIFNKSWKMNFCSFFYEIFYVSNHSSNQ